MSAPFSGGPLQQSDLLGIWQSVMDDSYTQPFVQAGDGQGLEAWNQSFAQLARVSTAVDVTMESLFILPWSGQTNPPATGPNQATVTLTISRTKLLNQPLILGAGFTWVDEVAPDWSPTGTQLITTGLRYSLMTDVVFEPGESGPLTVTAIAERPGYGYNNPQPGSLNTIEQPGTNFYNTDAQITNNLVGTPLAGIAATQLIVLDIPHTVIPGHIGQYFTVTQGTNVGAIARAVSYRAPAPGALATPEPVGSGLDGGAVGLEMLFSVHSSGGPTGTFIMGEQVSLSSGATGIAIFKHMVQVGSIWKASFVLRSLPTGTITAGLILTGVQSGATMTADLIYTNASNLVTTPVLQGISTETWRVLDWVNDWGLTVTNVAQPSGGTSGTLDLLGRERNTPRISGETDTQYRQRVAAIADVVTPNAIKRRLNKVLTQGPLGLNWCFREIGAPLFPGFYWDHDAYDYDAQIFGVGLSATGLQLYEPVTQTIGGVVARAKLLMQDAIPATPFVAGSAGTTGQRGARTVIGAAGFWVGHNFVAGQPVVGVYSKVSVTPVTISTNPMQNNEAVGPSAWAGPTTWRVLVDYIRMRGYFLVNIQRSGVGDFGFAWGGLTSGVGGLADWWDVGPNWNDFYDGAAIGAANYYLAAYHAIDAIRAAGVYFEVLPLSGPCV